MDAANTTSQAEQIKTDTHQTACVKNETSPPYVVPIRGEEENIIAKALEILARRMRRAEAFFNSPAAVRDYLRLKMAELEFEVFSVIFLDAQHGVITTEEMFRGTLTQTSVYPREVVKRALHHNAAAVIFSQPPEWSMRAEQVGRDADRCAKAGAVLGGREVSGSLHRGRDGVHELCGTWPDLSANTFDMASRGRRCTLFFRLGSKRCSQSGRGLQLR